MRKATNILSIRKGKLAKEMLYLVGFGPGSYEGMTIEAEECLRKSDVIVGYSVYTELVKKIFPDKEYQSTTMGREMERVRMAIGIAQEGKEVAIVCSGDSVLYGMAGLAYQLAAGQKERKVEIRVIPGVTAAMSGSALLGAPLTHDLCIIILSDLLTPWETIEKRLACAAEADFEIVFYNPSSKKRAGYLKKACEIILQYRTEQCVCGYVTNIAREGEYVRVLTLKELKDIQTDMFTTVFIGNSQTQNIEGRMVTPRGYRMNEM